VDDEEPVIRVSEPAIPRNRKPVLVRLFGRWLLWLLGLGAILGGALSWVWLNFSAPGPLAEKKIFEIPKSMSREEIAVALKEQGIISDARIFSSAAGINAFRGGRLKPGEYEFSKNISMQDVLSMITAGKVLLYKVTIPEGWTSQMVVNRLNEQGELDGTIGKVPDEGAVLPDTYVFRRGLTRDKLLADMQAAQTKLLDDEWSRLSPDSPIKTKQELVTLASIVEKETGVAEERPMVAAVFINRLKKKMRLQSDPTIIYGLVGGKGKLDHPITRTELDQSTPYNTYQIDALPPGPIANPGKAAIEAVLTPAKNDFIYFVANGTGGHAFATTLEEHNANVKKWRALNNEPEATPPEPAVAPVDPAKPADPAMPADPAKTVDPVKPVEAAKPPVPEAKPAAAEPVPAAAPAKKKIPIPTLKKPKK
jgi:UPF0755 protein